MIDHKLRETTREIKSHICDEEGCEYRGETSVQGHCYSSDGDLIRFDALDKHEAETMADLKAMREREGDGYLECLEAHYISAMLNWTGTLDECVRLRRDNARLRKQIESGK